MTDNNSKARAAEQTQMDSAMGASDANNGGGSGAGVPDAETAMRVGDPGHSADVKKDRAKLFPDAKSRPGSDAGNNDADEVDDQGVPNPT